MNLKKKHPKQMPWQVVGRLISFWDDLFSGAMLVLGRVSCLLKILREGIFSTAPCMDFSRSVNGLRLGGIEYHFLNWNSQ